MTPTNSHLVKLSTRLEKGTEDYKTELGLPHSHSWTQGIGSSTLSGRTLALVVFKPSMSETFPEAPVIGAETGGYPRCKSSDDFSRDARREEEARNPLAVGIIEQISQCSAFRRRNCHLVERLLFGVALIILLLTNLPIVQAEEMMMACPQRNKPPARRLRHCDQRDSQMPSQRAFLCTAGGMVTKRCKRSFSSL